MDNKTINTLTNEQNSEKNDNKVIRLDTRRTRRMQMKLDFENRKGAIAASVLSVIALVTILNQSLISKNQSRSQGRQIASAENEQKIKAWKQDLLKDLSQNQSRGLASYGKDPSPLEQLRMETLEGKYSFQIQEDIVQEIKFIEKPDGDRPKSFSNYTEFVRDHMKAFNPSIASVVEKSKEVTAQDKQYTYEVLDEANQPVGKIVIVSDLSNRFIHATYKR